MLTETGLTASDGEWPVYPIAIPLVLFNMFHGLVKLGWYWGYHTRLPGLCSHRLVTWCFFKVRYQSVRLALPSHLSPSSVDLRLPTLTSFSLTFHTCYPRVFLYKQPVLIAGDFSFHVETTLIISRRFLWTSVQHLAYCSTFRSSPTEWLLA